MSFFIRKGGTAKPGLPGKKRKAPVTGKNDKTKKKREDDEEIDSEGSDIEGRPDAGYESEESDHETAEEKRLRLARVYLEEIEKELEERRDVEDKDAAITEILSGDVQAERGKLRKEVTDTYLEVQQDAIKFLTDKNHKLSITCVVISPDSRYIYSGSKDAGLVKWDINTGEKLVKITGGKKGHEYQHHGHCYSLLSLAVSSDGKYLASGDAGKLIYIWEADSMNKIHRFRGHRDGVSGLVFRRGTHTLYSCSWDRSVKIWEIDEKAYVETLFGHQDRISAIDCGSRERCVTAGGRDGTVRVWKIAEESQLVFNGPATSIDTVKLLNEEHWMSSGEDGHLATWGVMKKKPLAVVHYCHGQDQSNGDPHWVSALATLYNTDMVATGSRDGWVRIWKVGVAFKTLTQVQQIKIPGFVNSLALSADGQHLVAGLGQEHRLGRWWRDKTAKNKVAVIKLLKKEKEMDEPMQDIDNKLPF